jgi:uncharacterized 2Fe-2S/4Fe-4S cluster protein (DUF4445 family)
MFPIRLLPEDRTFAAESPIELFLAAASCEIWVEQPCGAKKTCGKCRVRVLEGAPAATDADRSVLSAGDIAAGWRLGCRLVLDRAAVVEIPPVTRSVAAKTFGDPALYEGRPFAPNFQQRCLEIAPPDEDNQYAAMELLARAAGVGAFHAEPSLLHSVQAVLQRNEYRVWAVWASDSLELLDLGPWASSPQPPAASLGAAVDLGTTTLAAALVNLSSGAVLATLSRLNPQVVYGADVITRIHYAVDQAAGNRQLHETVIGAVAEMLGELAAQAGIAAADIYALTFAGNPTMMHTAMGADIRPLGHAPYVGAWTRETTVKARDVGLPVHQRALARFLPMIRSHVGADTVAAVLAAGMDRSEGWRLVIDLGTNSEVVLGCRERMVATSAAAGPAFEGANIHQGMRAAPGAIDAVRVAPDGRIMVKTVASEPACGICGSGLVDAAAALRAAGLIAPSGYLRSGAELARLPARLASQVVLLEDGQRAVKLAEQVVLTGSDIRQLQLVKGSIRAAVEILLRDAGLTAADLEEVNLAGAFGNFLNKASALEIGLLPEIDPERVRFIGNAAGAGARMVLVDAEARARARRIGEMCEYVELAVHPGYQDAFCEAIPFP